MLLYSLLSHCEADKASCSCLEGNPCAVQYNCKNWARRYEVAEAVMKSRGASKADIHAIAGK
jgi:hypothetical protein